ncbi:hypothetical protein Fmac_015922 [Flemingia macrophylla]|uniref:Uncharacterized protein n=1 Tax=Flemingia macrophylla TaxID=520843 RepID=A0ABD1MFX4_9FABA
MPTNSSTVFSSPTPKSSPASTTTLVFSPTTGSPSTPNSSSTTASPASPSSSSFACGPSFSTPTISSTLSTNSSRWASTPPPPSEPLIRPSGIAEFTPLPSGKRLLPKAIVLRFLASHGLRKEGANVIRPFHGTEKLFLETFVMRFRDHSLMLLETYKEAMNIENDIHREKEKNKTCM